MEPEFAAAAEGTSALISDVAKARELFGTPPVSPAEMMEWIAEWIKSGGNTLDKPTHFQTRDGTF